MKFFLVHVCTLLSVSLVGSHAATPEVYWKSVLPNSPMPKSIKDLLYTEWNDEKSTAVGVGKGGVSVHTGKPGKRTDVGVGKGGVGVHTGKPGKGTDVGVGKGGVGVHTGKPGKRTDVGVGKGGVEVHTGHKGKPVYVGVHKGPDPFVYLYAASEDQLKDNPNIAMFFLENDLHQGKEMNLHFTKNDQKATFLPRKIADSIPFSSNKLPQIYDEFSVKTDSMEAEIMKQTLNECESTGIEDEEKYCATSLESMVDFSTTKLGKNVKAISTEVSAKESTPLQKYKIKVAKKLAANKAVVCHKQNYAYAVFYCHKTISTQAYAVSMVGGDGTKVNAVAVCHTDTAKWNPKHLAFQVLKVKPGTVPICHFLPEDHVVWVPY
ncbi:putative BURP domain-containing protein [Helianthus annuus]|uniref:BURP domain-containing protein n=1 Tax=Helianthus annuus TaxID=4232 RepID=A0A251VS85_HELAN|nr:BURP domain protein RD22 [Helianthus annuus]KAF5823859.1 putative BURP domain-containing protein [Helianthus annuus]KAJ0613191.1 putative BURP domain-containing protein [Helianthus annuus]KAJ0628529.1 putative BURP domain-containing protein [Helianthus annuus]KAJ0949927.1 putative BURP domain-containing protein [Helianthus annuus]KAJ0958765.1 putative BURP domain-containing protein [Helianthus annuus]